MSIALPRHPISVYKPSHAGNPFQTGIYKPPRAQAGNRMKRTHSNRIKRTHSQAQPEEAWYSAFSGVCWDHLDEPDDEFEARYRIGRYICRSPRFRDLLPTLHEDHPTVQIDLGLRTRGPACLQINPGGVLRVMWGPRELSSHTVTSASELHLTMGNIVCSVVWKERGAYFSPNGVNWRLLTDAKHGLLTRYDVMVYLCESGKYKELDLEYVNQKGVASVNVKREGSIDMQTDGRTIFTWKTKVEMDQVVTNFHELWAFMNVVSSHVRA